MFSLCQVLQQSLLSRVRFGGIEYMFYDCSPVFLLATVSSGILRALAHT